MSTASAGSRHHLIWAIIGALAIAGMGGLAWSQLHHPSADTAGVSKAAGDDSETGILLGLASAALKENHLVAPAGANAFEFYLSVLQLDPRNRKAHDGLQQWTSTAQEEVERNINIRQLDEAQRELGLLHDADNSNYVVSLLSSKLDAQRALVVRQDEARAAMIQAQHAAPLKH